MRIYAFANQLYQAYPYAPHDQGTKCDPGPPRSLATGWAPPTFTLASRDESRSYLPLTDFPTYYQSTPFLSTLAVERLRPTLELCGELLPIRIANHRDDFYLFNVTRIINAVDMRRSKFLKLPSGAIGPCELLVFDPALIPEDTLFFKTTQMGPITKVFATERAVAAVRSARLTGHDFQLAWTDD